MSPGSKRFPPGTTVASPHCSQNGPDVAASVVLSPSRHGFGKNCQPRRDWAAEMPLGVGYILGKESAAAALAGKTGMPGSKGN